MPSNKRQKDPSKGALRSPSVQGQGTGYEKGISADSARKKNNKLD